MRKIVVIILGILLIISGLVIALIPFIPFGYLGILAGAIVLTPHIKSLDRFFNKVKKKDDTGTIKKLKDYIDENA